MSSLFIAKRTGRVDDLQSSISAGTDDNAKDRCVTSLDLNILNSHVGIVKASIDAGADVNLRNNVKMFPITCAVILGHFDIVKLLIAAGADVNVKQGYGFTPLHHSCMLGHIDIVKVLIAAGADVNATTEFGSSYSSFIPSPNLMNSFIAAGSIINNVGLVEFSALSMSGGHIGIVKVLIAAGAKTNLISAMHLPPKDKMGQALIKYSLLYQYRSIMKSKEVQNSLMRSKVWKECKKQVEKMLDTRLGVTSTSFFKLMTETDKNKLALYFSKKKFGLNRELGKISYIKKFPMYITDIKARFKIGNERACLLLKCQKLMAHCFCYVLPAEVIEKICQFMTNEDIQSFLMKNKGLK